MTEIRFTTPEITEDQQGEIDEVLQRIGVGDTPGLWHSEPDEIRIVNRLAGGRSGAEVLEAVVRWGRQESRKIVKLGPRHDLRNEFRAWKKFLQTASRFFVPIDAVTPALLEDNPPPEMEREAVIYDHADRFVGGTTQTFERAARQAIATGGPRLAQCLAALRTLFAGIRNDLYEKYDVEEHSTSLHAVWNRRLGDDAKVAISEVHPETKQLRTTTSGLTRWWPRDLAKASVRVDNTALPAAVITFNKARLVWWGKRLMAEVDRHGLRVEIAAEDGLEMQHLTQLIHDDSEWRIEGRLLELRGSKHCDRLLRKVPELSRDSGALIGPEAVVADPFACLAEVMEGRRTGRINSLVHGDLNPRNVLLVGEEPCVIDYALTRAGEPIFFDFVRLEGCLIRDALPAEVTWAQHVRLQRLLAWASHLGEAAAGDLAARLEAERPELGHAFQLCWAIRQAAREVYPEAYRGQWLQDYLEQLFLFAQLTLKWEEQAEAAPRASAAMAGVAAEHLLPGVAFRWWEETALRGDGLAVVEAMRREHRFVLPALASFADRVIPFVEKQDDPLQLALDTVRAAYVREHDHDEANEILHRLQADHDVYISLRAFIELRGQLSAGRSRQRREELSLERLLNDEELLADRERLQEEGAHQDALTFIASQPALILLGDAGAGKTTVAREWEYQLAQAIVEATDQLSPRLPLVVRASAIEARLNRWKENEPASTAEVLEASPYTLAIGARHLIVDALNELSEKPRRKVADWVIAIKRTFPQTPVLVCHRQYNYLPGLLPFPILLLQKVDVEQARRYIQDYLREKELPDHAQRAETLAHYLLDNPDYQQVRDLAQTPLFLWMLVERFRQTNTLPESRGGLFDDFSHWYLEERHHAEHREPIPQQQSYTDKACLLGCLGYELVRRRETEFPERDVKRFIPAVLREQWEAVLAEIITAEMLLREDDKLRFLHQSFQEYFAARHFLAHDARDENLLRKRVREHGWHDTFALLLGFGGDRPEVIRQITEEALRVNAILTGRCLRMAEIPDPELLAHFVDSQRQVLLNEQAGAFPHEYAANALSEYGRGPARAALWEVATAATAPAPSRVLCIARLAAMLGQTRFEVIAEKLREELVHGFTHIFDERAPVIVQEAALKAAAETNLKQLGPYLADLVQEGTWSLQRAAWKACEELGLPLTPRQRAVFLAACHQRLDPLEQAIANEVVDETYDALGEERVEILRYLASPENISILLAHRFTSNSHNELERIIDTLIATENKSRRKPQEVWKVLTEKPRKLSDAIDRWLSLLHTGDEVMALAAGHRLCKVAGAIPVEKLIGLFDATLSPQRLSAMAQIVSENWEDALIEPLEQFIRSMIETVTGYEAMEAFSNLVTALIALDEKRGNRVTAIADMVFFTRRYKETTPGVSTWHKIYCNNILSDDDINALLESKASDEMYAAIMWLCAFGDGVLRNADKPTIFTLTEAASAQFMKTTEADIKPAWRNRLAKASVMLNATSLVPWLLRQLESSLMDTSEYNTWHIRYGSIIERYSCHILCAIGYLTRILLNEKRMEEAQPAVTYLQQRSATLSPETERSIVIGLTIALGYLGDWEPILTHLGPGEPWMHEAAINSFKYWVPGPLAEEPNREHERAIRWILHRLREHPELPAEVRSTLFRIKDNVESRLGRHIVEEDP